MNLISRSSDHGSVSRRSFLGSAVAAAAFTQVTSYASGRFPDDVDPQVLHAKRPAPPYRVWFQPRLFQRDVDLYRNMTMDASGWLDPRLAEAMGKTTLDWVYGLQHPWATSPDYWHDACSATSRTKGNRLISAGIAIDEWVPPELEQSPQWLAEGLRAGRRENPDIFIAVWITDPTPPLFELVREGTVDLVIVEGYTHLAPDAPSTLATSWEGGLRRCQTMAEKGLIENTILCFGHITPGTQRNGQPLTKDWLRERAEELQGRFPEMPGIAFFQRGDDDTAEFRDLIQYCDQLSGELWPS